MSRESFVRQMLRRYPVRSDRRAQLRLLAKLEQPTGKASP